MVPLIFEELGTKQRPKKSEKSATGFAQFRAKGVDFGPSFAFEIDSMIYGTWYDTGQGEGQIGLANVPITYFRMYQVYTYLVDDTRNIFSSQQASLTRL